MSNLSQEEIASRLNWFDGEIKKVELYAALWIAKINSGAYLLYEGKRGREATEEEKERGESMGWRELTDKEKLDYAVNIALTHITRHEKLYYNRQKTLENKIEEMED